MKSKYYFYNIYYNYYDLKTFYYNEIGKPKVIELYKFRQEKYKIFNRLSVCYYNESTELHKIIIRLKYKKYKDMFNIIHKYIDKTKNYYYILIIFIDIFITFYSEEFAIEIIKNHGLVYNSIPTIYSCQNKRVIQFVEDNFNIINNDKTLKPTIQQIFDNREKYNYKGSFNYLNDKIEDEFI